MDFKSWVRVWRAVSILVAFFACQQGAVAGGYSKGETPIPGATLALMRARDTTAEAPILIRTYKKEAELEIWKQARNGRFVLLKTFPICRWSGQLGPKSQQGDRQAPEGFYWVGPKQMNPNSAYYLSFDVGYPNAYDKAHGGSGSYVMVHGTCSSAGCFAMTDKGVGEIYAIAREALRGGQQAFQFQAYPFRMTAQNMAKYRLDANIAFWRQLKEGSDRFEATGEEPLVSVASGRYVFSPSKDPDKETLAQTHHLEEQARIATLVAEGSAAIQTTYADGGQHPAFRALARQGTLLGEVSRPEALADAGREVIIVPAHPKRLAKGGAAARLIQTAAAKGTNPTEAKPVPSMVSASLVPSASSVFGPVVQSKTEPSVFAPAPMSYRLGRLAPAQSMMTGAMPILPAVLVD
ncbi:L,D-transpeptidase family protein [Beijerinckia indica]|uniref:L,D-TPase catalytic domain-containing protein n=1 Tax=Beijerinckia indica subsp. indica (strain ATCC 9039 / DSM 1715 / NCIMB 8712) TaxID=395963 RepID=B2IF03_BEII9|nr:murein L,D-transpeptidase family protein [Beijerinckia indica]ACB94194.1 protein of unknown function DUF949 [Beijerinckia indica subsp. indica ATCC 9039]